MTHRQSPRRAGRIDVAAPETFPRRRSHAYFPCDKGDARLRRGDARHLPQPRACVRPDGRRAGRGAFCPASFWGRAFPRFAPRGFNPRFDFNRSASIASPPSGLITSDSTASAPTGSIASAPASLAATSFSSAAGAVGVGAASPLRLGPTAPVIVGDGAPVIINVGADPAPGAAAAGYGGACVIHKLIYDSSGKYAGERQSPQC